MEYLEDFERKSFYAETVFRTNLTSHYNLGIIHSYDTEYFEYVAILDGRTTEICRSLNGKIFKKTDTRILPPNHYNCRSVVVPAPIPIQEPIEIDKFAKTYKEYADFLYEVALLEIPPTVWETIREYVSADLIEEVNETLRELLEGGN